MIHQPKNNDSDKNKTNNIFYVARNRYAELFICNNTIIVSNYIYGFEYKWLYHMEFRRYECSTKKKIWSLSHNQLIYKQVYEQARKQMHKQAHKQSKQFNRVDQSNQTNQVEQHKSDYCDLFVYDLMNRYDVSKDTIYALLSFIPNRLIYGYGSLFDNIFYSSDTMHIIVTEGLVDAFVLDTIVTRSTGRYNISVMGCSAFQYKKLAEMIIKIYNAGLLNNKTINIYLLGDNDKTGNIAIRSFRHSIFKSMTDESINIFDLRYLYKPHKDIIDALIYDKSSYGWLHALVDHIISNDKIPK